jgi:hypothetical protein
MEIEITPHPAMPKELPSLPRDGSDGTGTDLRERTEGDLQQGVPDQFAEGLGEESVRLRSISPERRTESPPVSGRWVEGMPPGWFTLALEKVAGTTSSSEVMLSHTPDW